MHPLGPIALVGAQVLDGYKGAPISDGVVICEDDDIISGRLYYGDSMHQKWLDRVPLPDFLVVGRGRYSFFDQARQFAS